jgi:hypothetical protein
MINLSGYSIIEQGVSFNLILGADIGMEVVVI